MPASPVRIDHGLTEAALAEIAVGTVLHFTNHPCRPSVPVTLAGPRGRVLLPSGQELYAFADELSLAARDGLGA